MLHIVWLRLPGTRCIRYFQTKLLFTSIRPLLNRPSWDRLVLPYWWTVVAIVILLSTRGIADSDIWFMCLADKPMVRRYHLTDYDWTPLSQIPACNAAMNSCPDGDGHKQTADGLLLEPISDLAQARQGPPPGWCILLFERRGAKSFAKDLVEDWGVVINRAVFSLRFVESKPQDFSISQQNCYCAAKHIYHTNFMHCTTKNGDFLFVRRKRNARDRSVFSSYKVMI